MRLAKLYIRFYKSFNYDYERKFARGSSPDQWEYVNGLWYPYVRLTLEPSITTIVGANESGKSHLLDAVEKVINGQGIERGEFCRYSHFFSVERGQRRFPDFGAEFEVLADEEVSLVRDKLGISLGTSRRFTLFRSNGEAPTVYVDSELQNDITVDQSLLDLMLPAVFRVDANVPLPASIPLYELTPKAERPSGSRRSRRDVLTKMLGRSWSNPTEWTTAAPSFYDLIRQASSTGTQHSLEDKAIRPRPRSPV